MALESVKGSFQVPHGAIIEGEEKLRPHGTDLEEADKVKGTHYGARLWTGESAVEVSRNCDM